MDMRKLIGRNVRRIRLDKGLTQEQYAELSGFTQQYISGLEVGRRNPTIVTHSPILSPVGPSGNRKGSVWVRHGCGKRGRVDVRGIGGPVLTNCLQ
jgi:DNA-binding XRE family transcriptional regulator